MLLIIYSAYGGVAPPEEVLWRYIYPVITIQLE